MRLRGERVVLRAVREPDVARLHELVRTPAVAAWWHEPEPAWPLGEADDDVPLVIEVDGRVGGFISFGEERDPDFRHAWIDLFVDPALHGRGLGTDALRTLARHLLDERGHHRLTIDPDAANAVAIRCYERVGFRPVGTMRAYGRSADRREWRDALLMDLLAGELR